MIFNIKHIQNRDLPIWLMFCIFPFVSIFAWGMGKGEVNYDYVWVLVFIVLLIYIALKKKIRLKKKNIYFLIVLLFLVVLKYILPWIYDSHLSITGSIMDGKWIVYLVLAILWIDMFGYPSINKTYKAGVFFSIIYILKTLYVISTGQLSRGGVLLEANYDGFMILMVYCFREQINNKKKWEVGVLILATFLTFSRTGIFALFAIWFAKIMRRNVLLLIPVVPVMLGIAYLGFSMRGADSAGNLDRFVYWQQAFILFNQSDLVELLFGYTPGESLNVPILPEFSWTVNLFEEMRNLNGVFPFMFHSTYLRLAIIWGIPIALFFALFLIVRYIKSSQEPMKQLCLITLIQSFSLSSLTLPNVSLLLFMLFITAMHQEYIVKRDKEYCANLLFTNGKI